MIWAMSVVQSVLLGILQGITEFLPVSSSGHLVMFRDVLGIEGIPLLYDVLLHVATLVVICVVFRSRIARLIRSAYLMVRRQVPEKEAAQCRKDLRAIVTIVIAVAWTAVVGMGISSIYSDIPVRLVYVLFLVTSAVLIIGKAAAPAKTSETMSPLKSSILGISQGFAALPGISRSGMTISAALVCGMNRKEAGEISFLISIPAVIGALILELAKNPEITGSVSVEALAAGCIAALISGFAALKLLLYLVREGKLYLFSIYLIPLGLYGLFFRV